MDGEQVQYVEIIYTYAHAGGWRISYVPFFFLADCFSIYYYYYYYYYFGCGGCWHCSKTISIKVSNIPPCENQIEDCFLHPYQIPFLIWSHRCRSATHPEINKNVCSREVHNNTKMADSYNELKRMGNSITEVQTTIEI